MEEHMTVEQMKQLFQFPVFNNQLPNMSTVPTHLAAAFPPNLQPGSSFAFGHVQNIPYFQVPPQTSSFASQPSQPSSQPSQTSRKKNQTEGPKGKEHWTIQEDVELCNSWLKISEDPIVGTGQRQAAFWARVTDEYNSQIKEKIQKYSSRSKDAAIARWSTIHPAVTKWSALHSTLTRNMPSGWTISNMESKIRTIYQSKYKEPFKFEECWKVLRDNYKWQTWMKERIDAAKRGSETSLQDTNTQSVDEPIIQQSTETVAETVATDSESLSAPMANDQTKTSKEQSPHLDGPASRDKPRPDGVKKTKNQRQRRKQQFSAEQTAVCDTITTTLMGVDSRAEERNRQNDELKRRRDEIMDQRYEEYKQMLEKENARKERKEAKEALFSKAKIAKGMKYLIDQLDEAYGDLEALSESSIHTPREKLRYKRKREWVKTLEDQYEGLKMHLVKEQMHAQSSVAQQSFDGEWEFERDQ